MKCQQINNFAKSRISAVLYSVVESSLPKRSTEIYGAQYGIHVGVPWSGTNMAAGNQ